jgi:hypothetical protein
MKLRYEGQRGTSFNSKCSFPHLIHHGVIEQKFHRYLISFNSKTPFLLYSEYLGETMIKRTKPSPHLRTILQHRMSAEKVPTISCVALCPSASSAASDQLYFVWDSRKGKSTGSDHHLTYKRYYNLVCLL